MFVDASALAGILLSEPDAQSLERRLFDSKSGLMTSPLALFETALAIAPKLRLSHAEAEIRARTYAALDMAVIPITAEIGRLALEAHSR